MTRSDFDTIDDLMDDPRTRELTPRDVLDQIAAYSMMAEEARREFRVHMMAARFCATHKARAGFLYFARCSVERLQMARIELKRINGGLRFGKYSQAEVAPGVHQLVLAVAS